MDREDLIRKIKEALDIRETDIDDSELYYLLETSRNRYHPDRTTDEDTKKLYEEKFKQLSGLLTKLGEYLNSFPIRTPQDLVHYKQNIEPIELKRTNQLLQDKVKNLQEQVESLNREIARLQDVNSKEEIKQLIEQYKPTANNVYAAGFTAFLLLAFQALLQVEKFSDFFIKYMPFVTSNQAKSSTLIALIAIFLLFLRKYAQEGVVNDLTKRVTSTAFHMRFFNDCSLYSGFTEIELVDYIKKTFFYENINEGALKSKKSNKIRTNFYSRLSAAYTKSFAKLYYITSRFGLTIVLGLNMESVSESLKNIMIHTLLKKNVIKGDGNNYLEKQFKVQE